MNIGIIKIGQTITYGKMKDNGSIEPYIDMRGSLGETHAIIDILSNRNKDNLLILTDLSDNNYIPYKYSKTDILNIYQNKDMSSLENTDILIVINGSKYGPDCSEKNFKLNLANYWIIENFKGNVCYIMCDLELPLKTEMSSEYECEKIRRKDIFCITQAHNVSVLKSELEKDDSNVVFKDIQYFPFEKFPCLKESNRIQPNECPKYDLMYGGSIRLGRRANKIAKFMYGHKNSNVLLFGKMDEELLSSIAKSEYGTEQYPPKYEGLVPYDKFCLKMNDSLATVIIGDEIYEKTNDIAQRCYESMMAGTIAFIDSELDKDKTVFGKFPILKDFMYVDDYNDLSEKISVVKKYRCMYDYIIECQNIITDIDKNEYCENLISILYEIQSVQY